MNLTTEEILEMAKKALPEDQRDDFASDFSRLGDNHPRVRVIVNFAASAYAAGAAAERNATDRFVRIEESNDGVWAHFRAGQYSYSENLSASELSRPFAIHYHNAIKKKKSQEIM